MNGPEPLVASLRAGCVEVGSACEGVSPNVSPLVMRDAHGVPFAIRQRMFLELRVSLARLAVTAFESSSMKIQVKGFLSVKEVMGRNGEIELEMPEPTVRQALDELCRRCGPEFRQLMFDAETGNPRPENPILVNGRHYRHFAHGLDTRLRDEDLLAVFPPVAGG